MASPAEDGALPLTEPLEVLRGLGFTERDQLRLRFAFEESSLQRAVALAAELRTMTRSSVQVRPRRWLLRRRRWAIALTTGPVPAAAVVLELWAKEMEDVAARRADCRLVGWEPLLDRASPARSQ